MKWEKEIFIIRHGETDFNRRGIIQGRGVNTSINETGQQQAQLFYQKFKNHPFEVVFTSSLKRTHQTVKPFIDAGLKWEQHPELDEIDWGHHEGRLSNRLMKEEYSRLLSNWRDNILDVATPGGETPLALQLRQSQFIEYMLEQPYRQILICTHGRAMRSLLCTMLQRELCSMDEFPHTNVSLYKVVWNGRKFEIDIFNNTDHLDAQI